jgi:serine/threonine-protein kinase RsbW
MTGPRRDEKWPPGLPGAQPADGCHGRAEPLALVMPSWARVFPGRPQQAGAARRFVASLLDGSPFRDDAVVVVSELFTNAVQHTDSGKPGGLVVVQVSRWLFAVRLAVTDQGSSRPPFICGAAPGELAENGNGLRMVSHLAESLDWHDDAAGRTICAVLSTHRAGRRHRPPALAWAGEPSRLPQPA